MKGIVIFMVDSARGGVSTFTVPKNLCVPMRLLFDLIADALDALEHTGEKQKRVQSPVF